MQFNAQALRAYANRATAPRRNAGALGLHAAKPASAALARVSRRGAPNMVVGAELPDWNIDLRPFTRFGLEQALEILPALRAIDPRLLATISLAPQAQGLGARMRKNAGGQFGDPTFQFPDDEDPSGGWIDVGQGQTTQGAGASGSSDPDDPSLGGGLLGGIGDVLGNLGGDEIDPGIDPDFSNDGDGGGSDSGGAVEQVPGTQGTADQGVLLQVQVDLGIWNRQFPGQCEPADYGSTPDEFTGVADDRMTSALRSYQFWADQTKGETLIADGFLDPPTYISLTNTVAPFLAGEGTEQDASSGGDGRILGFTPTELAIGGAVLVGGYLLIKGKRAA